MRKNMKKTVKRRLSICLSFILVLSQFYTASPSNSLKVAKAAGYGLSNPRIDSVGVTTWDCIYFGNYWQNDTNGDGKADQDDAKQPIKWRVLSVNGTDAFLLADQNLDCQKYHEISTPVTWETCTLRQWLNSEFYQNAFNNREQNAVLTTLVVNENNPSHGTPGGNYTSDKVYLLSISEAGNASYGFHRTDTVNSETREAKNSVYAKDQGAYHANNGNSWWWLRTPGNHSESAADVGYFGKIYHDGFGVSYRRNAVRPVLHLNIATTTWKKAGSVSSSGAGSGEDAGIRLIGKDRIVSSLQSETKKEGIRPPVRVKNLTVKNKNGRTLSLSWKKVKGARGYQIQYADNKKYKKKKSKQTKKTKYTIKKLKKKKTYYIRVRAYKLDGGKKVYSKWSKVKKVRVK